ncbi:MAG: hypothetical protein JWO52_2116 [Gammaproteobacteria bacterium]|nr:hypothetical protein [Gammaproteobacteria bacterium]
MLRELWFAHSRVLFVAACMLGWMSAHAQSSQVNSTCTNPPAQTSLLNEVHTIADPSQGVPVECSFDVSVAGTYRVTLSDLGIVAGTNPLVPAPLASVKLGVTSGTTVVGTVITAPGDMQFDATVGTYVIRVVGVPGTDPGSGPIGIKVTNVADNSLLASFSSTLAKPYLDFPATVGTLDDSFTVTSDGSYVVTLTDQQLPQPLTTLTLVITTSDGAFVTNPPLGAAGSATVTLQHGVTYRILAAGKTDTTVNAGLFSASVAPAGGGTPVYSKLVAIGTVAPLAAVTLNAGGTYALTLSDLSYPAPLTSLEAIVALNGQVVARLASAGTSPTFTGAAGSYQVFAVATAATSGSYAVSITSQGGAPALSVARTVSAPVGTTPSSYSFDTNVPTAGSYAFDLADFGFPTAFASLAAVVVQNGAVIGQPLTVAGTQTVAVSAGPLSVLVFSQPGTAGSLFGVGLTAANATSPVFETTQGVGQLFSARQISVTAAGGYAVNVSDVKFPAALATFAVVVTRGSQPVGSIYGHGAFAFQAATPGNYLVNFIATPDAKELAGTYSLSVVPGPSVQLGSDVTTVASGGVVHLKWTSVNTDSCTASDGWSGVKAVSDQATSAPLTADTTFTLTCSGEGATAAQSVKITVTAPPASSGGGGGGGALDVYLVLVLLGFALRWSSRRIRHAFVMHAA